jgi:hypothetical protein
MIENKAIFCHRYLSLSERKYQRSSVFCQRSSVPARDRNFLPPLFVPIKPTDSAHSPAGSIELDVLDGALQIRQSLLRVNLSGFHRVMPENLRQAYQIVLIVFKVTVCKGMTQQVRRNLD